MSSRKRQRLSIRIENELAIVSLDDMEIWDGADLALLREAMTALIENDGYRSLAVDLTSVKYIPSGFFGMLFEWYEAGLKIRLLSPQANVEQMLWFRMFFALEEGRTFLLSDEAVRGNSPGEQVEYHKRVFMTDDVEVDEDDDEIKSIRYGIRAPERLKTPS
ncbi:MAG: STAS domain-containing protein [Planctomyces sp.]|nr:STAS domain-containing protein [Planctomyces sp.]